jgi:hypothetical protein
MAYRDDIRLLITDVGGQDGTSFVFTDPQIDQFYNLRDQSVNRAAALALRVLAANELLIDKRINFLGLTTDGEAVADGLRKLAGELEEEADRNEGEIEVIEMDTTVAADRQLRWSGT